MEGTIGEIRYFAPDFAPKGWMLCQGQILRISAYNPLYAIIGNTYGGARAQGTFALPDFRSRMPVGAGNLSGTSSNYVLATTGGTERIALSVSEMAMHTHKWENISAAAPATPLAVDGSGDQDSPYLSYFASADDIFSPVETGNGGTSPILATGNTIAMQPAGGVDPHENRMPYTCISIIICVEGYYPTRG